MSGDLFEHGGYGAHFATPLKEAASPRAKVGAFSGGCRHAITDLADPAVQRWRCAAKPAEACVIRSHDDRVAVTLCQANGNIPNELFRSGFCQPEARQVEVEFVEQCPDGAFGICRDAQVSNMPYRQDTLLRRGQRCALSATGLRAEQSGPLAGAISAAQQAWGFHVEPRVSVPASACRNRRQSSAHGTQSVSCRFQCPAVFAVHGADELLVADKACLAPGHGRRGIRNGTSRACRHAR